LAMCIGSPLVGYTMKVTGRYKWVTSACCFGPLLAMLLISTFNENTASGLLWFSVIPMGLGFSGLLTSSLSPLSLARWLFAELWLQSLPKRRGHKHNWARSPASSSCSGPSDKFWASQHRPPSTKRRSRRNSTHTSARKHLSNGYGTAAPSSLTFRPSRGSWRNWPSSTRCATFFTLQPQDPLWSFWRPCPSQTGGWTRHGRSKRCRRTDDGKGFRLWT
jgi:hypothetical protein